MLTFFFFFLSWLDMKWQISITFLWGGEDVCGDHPSPLPRIQHLTKYLIWWIIKKTSLDKGKQLYLRKITLIKVLQTIVQCPYFHVQNIDSIWMTHTGWKERINRKRIICVYVLNIEYTIENNFPTLV